MSKHERIAELLFFLTAATQKHMPTALRLCDFLIKGIDGRYWPPVIDDPMIGLTDYQMAWDLYTYIFVPGTVIPEWFRLKGGEMFTR